MLAFQPLWGCTGAASEAVGFHEPDPQARIRAVQEAVETEDRAKLDELVEMLDSDDSAQRFFAINALEEITGNTFGYRHFDPPLVRREAINRWVEWLEGGRDAAAPADGAARAG